MSNRHPNEVIIANYQAMGFERDVIIQAWRECRGREDLMVDQLFTLELNLPSGTTRPTQHRRTAETARLLKKLPKTSHLRLKFGENDWVKYLELRKLGLFSKKAFRNIRGLSLEYVNQKRYGMHPITEDVKILGNHMHRNLRKLKYLSIKFDFYHIVESVSARPLLRSLKQTFVGLVHLKLSFLRSFRMSEWELWSYDNLFGKLRATLKHLELDYSMNNYQEKFQATRRENFSEELGLIIINRLHKLESLVLIFSWTKFPTKVVRLLINASGANLPHLRSLSMSFEGCNIAQEHWDLYSPENRKNSFQHLKLKFNNCADLTFEYLSLLRNDILNLCPLLNEFCLFTLECPKFPLFFSIMEKEFYENLPLKKLKLLSSNELERNWDGYQETEIVEMRQIMAMEEETMNIKSKAGGEEEWQLYYQTEMEEEKAPKEDEEFDEQEYLQDRAEKEKIIELEEYDRIERGIRWEVVEEDEENIYNGEIEQYRNFEEEEEEEHYSQLNQQFEEGQAAIDFAEEQMRRGWDY